MKYNITIHINKIIFFLFLMYKSKIMLTGLNIMLIITVSFSIHNHLYFKKVILE